MSFTSSLPAKEVRDSWATIGEVRVHYGVKDAEWRLVAESLGDADIDDLGLLSGVSDEDFASSRDGCGLTPLRKGAVNLMFGAVKARFGIRTAIVQFAQLDEDVTKSADKSLEVAAVEKGSPGEDKAPQLQAKLKIRIN